MSLEITDAQAPWIGCKGLVGQLHGNLFLTRMTIKPGDRQEDYDLCMSAFRRVGHYAVMVFESGKRVAIPSDLPKSRTPIFRKTKKNVCWRHVSGTNWLRYARTCLPAVRSKNSLPNPSTLYSLTAFSD